MKTIIAAAVLILAAAGASAQTSNFTGLSAGLNLNAVSVNTEVPIGTTSFNGIGQQSFNTAVQGAYGFAVNPTAVVSLGATYALGSSKAGDIGNASSLKLKKQFSVYVEPGYLVSSSTLVYGKLSYESASFNASDASQSMSKSVSGTGFGVGVRTMVNKASYVQVEIKQVGYGSARFDGDTTGFKTKSAVGTVGLGYRF